MLRVQTSYNSGSLAGVIDAALNCIESTILLSRSKDRVNSSEDAYASVAKHLDGVFAEMRGISQFAPEHYASDEEL